MAFIRLKDAVLLGDLTGSSPANSISRHSSRTLGKSGEQSRSGSFCGNSHVRPGKEKKSDKEIQFNYETVRFFTTSPTKHRIGKTS